MAAQKKLTFIEASCIITGYGVGGGIMAVPFLASLNGAAWTLLIMVAAYLISVIMHLMIAEMCSGDEQSSQIVELFRKYLFKGRFENLLVWLFFGLLVVILFSSMAAYIVGAGEILVNLIGLPLWAGQLFFYLIAAGVVAFGLKILGISEKYAIAAIAVIFLVLSAASTTVPFRAISVFAPAGNATLALFGMVMFCFSSYFSIPQAVEGLSWNKKLIPKAVLAGIGLNFIFVSIVTFFTLSVSEAVTEVAIIGWTGAVGNWAVILGSVFVFLAMLTTYWSVSYALVVIIKERLGWSERLSWLAATLPTLGIALAGLTTFLGFMRIVGGGIAVVVSLLLVPAFRASRVYKAVGGMHDWNIGLWGGTVFQVLVVAGYLLTAVGSFVELPH
ncbi:MAG: aromatic amino acid transport family protein [Bacillota bacterium]